MCTGNSTKGLASVVYFESSFFRIWIFLSGRAAKAFASCYFVRWIEEGYLFFRLQRMRSKIRGVLSISRRTLKDVLMIIPSDEASCTTFCDDSSLNFINE